jgi:hypothetical protein
MMSASSVPTGILLILVGHLTANWNEIVGQLTALSTLEGRA